MQEGNQKDKMIREEEKMIQDEYELMVAQREEQKRRSELVSKNEQLWMDANYQPAKVTSLNRHNFNIYGDKLLMHLVIQEEFDFEKISQIMTYTFKCQHKLYTDQICRERWYELHSHRQSYPLTKGKLPLLVKNQSSKQHNKKQNTQISQNMQIEQQKSPEELSNTNHGYNIFKDSIRRIDDLEKYYELQKIMKLALQKASLSIQLEKPMLYTPYYERLEQFQVLEEELTIQKMQQLMSHPIEMELMERQLKVLDLNEGNFESQVKKYVQKKYKQERIRNQEQFQIEQNWDQYESD